MAKDITIKSTLEDAIVTWGIDRLDAEVLLAFVLGKDRAWVITHLGDILSQEKQLDFFNLCRQRAVGVPLAYITGHKEFYSLDFVVTPHVLIPRPETELIIDTCLSIIWDKLGDHEGEILILDIGTGSGNIAVTLALHIPNVKVVALDISLDALGVARENARRHGVLSKITFVHSDLFEGMSDGVAFDFIVTNPPYIDIDLRGKLQKDLSFEPELALFAEDRGLSILKKILLMSPNYLKSDGYLISEIGHDQATMLLEFVRSKNLFKEARILKDLAGIDRVLVCNN